MYNRSSNIVVSIEVKIIIPNRPTLKAFIRSMWFSEKFILTGEITSGTRESIFEDHEIGDRIYTSFESVTIYTNKLCKFRVIGWAKLG